MRLSATPESVRVPAKLNFTLKTLDGAEFNGASLAGKASVLWFWAPWCGECRRDADIVARTSKAYADKVAFVGIAGWDKPEAMRKFVAEYKLDGFPHVADVDDVLFRKARIKGVPTILFFRSDGTNTVHVGPITEEQLVAELDKLSQR
nr:thioredoxin domain-containing protein [Kibdelosporangium sp. MJ126-NF4]CEL19784.1 PROBABLE CONSERVED LIPOPROTEIN DSBF [Kibdelosporangium sp. MJ126-NF4]CTQ97009.1 PROBABLE CONSERVED LIPOPROTEIN DSBF [Kibdelosporangium sp. MJ126-NF4]